MTKGFSNECRILSRFVMGLFRHWVIRASSLSLEKLLESGSVLAREISSKAWRVHHQHRDHASEKYKQNNRQADKNSIANWVALLFSASQRRNVGKIGGRRTQFCRSRFDLLELGKRSR